MGKGNHIPSRCILCKCVLEVYRERRAGFGVSYELLESWVLFEMLKAWIVIEEFACVSSVLVDHLL